MENKNTYTDLLYFGYEYDDESAKLEKDFIKEIQTVFLNVELRDVYDSIKGYRQEVYLYETQNDEYYAWLLSSGWFEMSLNMQLIMLDPSQKETFDKYLNLAKEQYPEAFKQ